MREAELLNALAQQDDGIRVIIKKDGIGISTQYTPFCYSEKKTLMSAAFDCAKQLLEAVKENPDDCYCPDVLKALEAYDLHSFYLSQ